MAPQSQVHLRGQLKVMGQKVVWTGSKAVDGGQYGVRLWSGMLIKLRERALGSSQGFGADLSFSLLEGPGPIGLWVL